MKLITSFFTAITIFFSSFFGLFSGVSSYRYIVDTTKLGDEVPNIVDNVNVWNMGTMFFNPTRNEKYDTFEFVKYIQLMQCTGGSAERDLFIDPYDTSTLTDYKFEPLIENCRGILSLGAKPHLKLGSVPLKFTSGSEIGGFSTNIYPPDDYNQYYVYIKAVAQALVDEFGLDEVKTWRFSCMTEYENGDWFMAKSKDPVDSFNAYCKLYDYTVQALVDVIGKDVFVGAHCMGVTEGLWDERDFLKHCGVGTNYVTGEKGTKICFLAASYYDLRPGLFTEGYPLPKLMSRLQKAAKKYGLNDLIYGVDEGRIYSGVNRGATDIQLVSRTTGYTWQAAYDARLFTQSINSGMDYFSSWSLLSGGLFDGFPTVSYHVAENLAKFAGGKQTKVRASHLNAGCKIESDCLSSWDEDTQTLRLMTYNFKNDLAYNKEMNVYLKVKLPQLDGRTVTVRKYLINDDCNFFDEWQEDRKTYGIGDDCFSWSPDDASVESGATLSDTDARKLYFSELRDKYESCAQLSPTTENLTVEDGKLELSETLEAGNVVFYEISVMKQIVFY